MGIKHITVMIEPKSSDVNYYLASNPNPKSVHEDTNYHQLVYELQEQSAAKVTLVENVVETAPSRGIIILYPRSYGLSFKEVLNSYEPSFRKTLLPRLVLLNIPLVETREILSQYNPAAIVEFMDYNNWNNLEKTITQQQSMYGVTAVAKEIGAIIRSGEERYCRLVGNQLERLPALLMRYLEAYTRIVPGGAGMNW